MVRQNAKFEPSPTAEFTEPVVEGFRRITDKSIRGTSVALSMATTLLAFRAGDRMNVRLGPKAEPAYEQYIDEENRVIIAGFGRIGQIVSRILGVRHIGFTALETSADQVNLVRCAFA